MYKYIPVEIKDHEAVLGKDFSANFAREMKAYYAPFIARNRIIQVAKETWSFRILVNSIAPLDKLVKSLLSKGRGLPVRIRGGVPSSCS